MPAHDQLRALIEQALDLDTVEERERLLDACGDAALAAEARVLLGLQAQAERLDQATKGVAQIDDALRLPAHIGPYRILGLLGSGGMGAVYHGMRADGSFRKEVAIKIVRDAYSAEQRARFARERELLARLEHPAIARILDGGSTESGQLWMAIERVEGVPLDQYVRERQLLLRERIALLLRVVDAVQFAHQNLIVHRDLKPSNVLVQADGQPKLLDFGVAKLLGEADHTQTAGRAPMTLAYAAPEQIKGEPITTTTDVYALGVMLYELLSGERPHKAKGENPLSLLQAITDTDATAPSSVVSQNETTAIPILAKQLRGDLDTICLKALNRDPGRRYPSAQAFAEDLRAYLADRPIRARPDSTWYLAEKWLRRHRGIAALGMISILSIATGTGLVWYQAQIAQRESTRAQAEQQKAERQAELANSVRQVLSGMFLEVNPLRRSSSEISVKLLLDQALLRVGRELADNAQARLLVMIDLGRAYFNVVDQARGIELLEATYLEAASQATELRARAALYYMRAALAFGRAEHRKEIDELLRVNPFAAGSDEWFDAEVLSVLRMSDPEQSATTNAALQLSALRTLASQPAVSDIPQRRFEVRKEIASRLSAIGDFDAADAAYEELIEVARVTQPPLQVASLLHNRAFSTERPSDLKLALLQEAIDIYAQELGAEHLHTLNARNIRAGILMGGGHPEGFAEAQAVIALQRKLNGTHVIASLLNLSHGYRQIRQFALAMEAIEEAQRRTRELGLTAEHAFSTGAAFAEIECLIGAGEWETAQQKIVEQRALRTRLGDSLASINFAQALLWREQAHATSVPEHMAQKTLAMLQSDLEPAVSSFFGARLRLLGGESALALGDVAKGRRWLSEAYDFCQKNAPVDLAFCARSEWQLGIALAQSDNAVDRIKSAELKANASKAMSEILPKDDPWRGRYR